VASITEFLEARIAEDEAQARAVLATVAPDEWENPTKWGNFYAEDVAFWDSQTPARILAECVAKRAIVGLHKVGADQCDEHNAMFESIPCPTILALAAVYKDHPDYRQEWARG
jgi:hypothetical protein